MNMNAVTQEYKDTTVESLKEYLIEQFSDEIEGAKEYYEQACYAKEIGRAQMSTMLINHALGELRHADEILVEIKREMPDMENNPLYFLMKKTIKRLEHVREDIEEF